MWYRYICDCSHRHMCVPTYMCIWRNRFQDLALCSSRNYLAASDRFIASSLKLEVHRTIRKRLWVGEVTKREASRVLWNLPSSSGVYENRMISTEIHQFQLPLTLDDMNSLQKLGRRHHCEVQYAHTSCEGWRSWRKSQAVWKGCRCGDGLIPARWAISWVTTCELQTSDLWSCCKSFSQDSP